MRIVTEGGLAVYVYPEGGARHKLPHCHVRWAESDTVIALPSLRRLVGPPLPKLGGDMLRKNLDLIWDQWLALNGQDEKELPKEDE